MKPEMSPAPEFEVAKSRIMGFVNKWHGLMDMDWLDIHHTFNPNYSEDDQFIVATTQVDWEYRAGVTDWHLPRVCAISDRTLEAVVVHENVHYLVAPLESTLNAKGSKLGEYTVESVARAMLSIQKGGAIPKINLIGGGS